MNVGYQRYVAKSCRSDLVSNRSKAFGSGDIRSCDANDLTTDLGQRDRLLYRGSDILSVARGHRLQANRILPANSHAAVSEKIGNIRPSAATPNRLTWNLDELYFKK